MDWQIVITWFAITLAGGYVFLRSRRAWRGTKSGGCGGACGCPKSSAEAKTQPVLIKPEQLVLRQRR